MWRGRPPCHTADDHEDGSVLLAQPGQAEVHLAHQTGELVSSDVIGGALGSLPEFVGSEDMRPVIDSANGTSTISASRTTRAERATWRLFAP